MRDDVTHELLDLLDVFHRVIYDHFLTLEKLHARQIMSCPPVIKMFMLSCPKANAIYLTSRLLSDAEELVVVNLVFEPDSLLGGF